VSSVYRLAWFALGLSTARVAAAQGWQGTSNPALDHAVHAFWDARSDNEVAAAAEALIASGAEPDSAWKRLASGPAFSPRVAKGRLNLRHQTSDGAHHNYTLVVPSTYDPAVPMPVRIYLHGNVNTEDKDNGSRWDFDRFTTPGGIAIYPSAWRGAMWWHDNQVENILGILADLKRTYNIDENRIDVIGVSDGGIGAFYLAFKDPTPFAAFLPLIGHAAALVNPRLGAMGPFYVPNLRNTHLFIVNGALDPLYPVREVAPYVALYRQAGVDLVFHPRAETGHDLRWWPEESAAIDSFIRSHPRDPFPDRISWETDRIDRFNRAYWLSIDSLGHLPGETSFPALDSVTPFPAEPTLGVRADPTSNQGVRLVAVELGSIGGAAGLLAGDRIIEVNGQPTPSVHALLDASQGLGWGDSMAVTFERDNIVRRIMVVLGPRPAANATHPVLAFPRPLPTGRVEVERRGNQIEVHTNGVTHYTLLLSPHQFHLDQPIRVVTNGKLSFEGVVPKSIETLVRWAARDRDRVMLYLAELKIDLTR
jgi:predicted esterase